MKHPQHIIAIPAHTVPYDGEGRALIKGSITGGDVIVAQRAMLEENPAYRQIIPYTVLRCGNKYAAYRRTEAGGEAGLHGKLSIGFGGHIDIQDLKFDPKTSIVDLDATITEGADREIEEELVFGDGVEITGHATLDEKIVSNANPVDQVHIGLVNFIDVSGEDVRSGEDQLEVLGFFTVEELRQFERLESWTEGLLDVL